MHAHPKDSAQGTSAMYTGERSDCIDAYACVSNLFMHEAEVLQHKRWKPHTDLVGAPSCATDFRAAIVPACPEQGIRAGLERANPRLRCFTAREPDSADPRQRGRRRRCLRTCRRRTPVTPPANVCTGRQFEHRTLLTHHLCFVREKRLVCKSRTGAEHLSQLRSVLCEGCFCRGRRAQYSCSFGVLSCLDVLAGLVVGLWSRFPIAARREVQVDRVRSSCGGRHLKQVRAHWQRNLPDRSPDRLGDAPGRLMFSSLTVGQLTISIVDQLECCNEGWPEECVQMKEDGVRVWRQLQFA